MKTQKYHHGNLEKALLSAGIREAKATGSKNLGVNSLAKVVNVSPMAVYRHFSSGEVLRASISQQAREELARRMIKAISVETTVKNRFRATGRTYIQFALKEPGLFAVAFVACDEGPKREDNPSAWVVFHDSILDLCNAGLIEANEVESVAAFAWSTVHGFATLVAGNDPKRPKANQNAVESLLDRVWFGIVKGREVAK
ncbi:MAG: TetR/AcrR family transcriptional regulator [Micrococcales bacterium]|nr:TetR/AcrR family transcriptional regulator [Microbacteriaceae bacterium]NBR22661.1 TetR/AcrR family transcriptional regulator [Micrococcales bacterium]NBX94603.1 TetR/AcrR family transcriptional regulator [Actinomycetota bacterium]NBR77665.1 TetR/AcrR family transcriptional regulator [Microbacteriaceae bacterium]NBS60899.1 TetR/AcrR family transcriptional regulator [Microbacteriaceae bacterium]